MSKDNIIQFPTPEQVSKKEAEEIINLASDECNGLAQHLCMVLNEEIQTASDYFDDTDFYNEERQESRDIYVITNLLNAMLLRHIEIPHELQRSLDKLYIKIKQLSQLPNQEFEVSFEPDFEFVPDFDININDEDDKDDT
jgi:hypothetical protein